MDEIHEEHTMDDTTFIKRLLIGLLSVMTVAGLATYTFIDSVQQTSFENRINISILESKIDNTNWKIDQLLIGLRTRDVVIDRLRDKISATKEK